MVTLYYNYLQVAITNGHYVIMTNNVKLFFYLGHTLPLFCTLYICQDDEFYLIFSHIFRTEVV